MSDKKYVVPDGMLKAAQNAGVSADGFRAYNLRECIEAAIRWLAENPIVPTDEQASDMWRTVGAGKADERYRIQSYLAEWQRICFLAPKPEVPDAVKDLLAPFAADGFPAMLAKSSIIEDYKRGKTDK